MTASPNPQFSHIGIYVTDLENMVEFYTRVLGFMITDQGRAFIGVDMVFLSRDPSEHHQIVLAPGKPADAPSQINQISFRLGSLDELRAMRAILDKEAEVSNIATMSHGSSWSVYFEDPEGNRIEMFVVTPWYIPAPNGFPLDLSQTDEEIYRSTEQKVKEFPGFMPKDDWHAAAADKMRASGILSNSE